MHRVVVCLVVAATLTLTSMRAIASEHEGLAHVEVRGDGDAHLVLIPGLLCDWTVWESFMDRNGDRFTMHAVTLPGFGGTEPPADPPTDAGTPWLDSAIEAIANYIDKAEIDKPFVVGHSLGGHVAFRMTYEHPDLIGGIVSVDGMAATPVGPGVTVTKEERIKQVSAASRQILNTSEEAWAAQFSAMGPIQMTDQAQYTEWKEKFLETPAKVGARYMLELMKSDVTEDLAEAGVPMLVMPADNKPQAQFMGGETAVRNMWARQVEHAPKDKLTVTYATDSRHFIMFDKPKWFDRQVYGFVSGNAGEE